MSRKCGSELPVYRGCGTQRRSEPKFCSIEAIVNDYIRNHRHNHPPSGLYDRLNYFRAQPSLESAVIKAARAEGPRGKLPHQKRIPNRALDKSAETLKPKIEDIKKNGADFLALHRFIRETIGSIQDIGDLTVYDTALHIGAKLDLLPQQVFLHADAREGARALGTGHGRESIEMSELPRQFQQLAPYEAEDCLCIYRRAFQNR